MAPRGLRCSKMASKMAQDSERSLKMSSIMPPRGPKSITRRILELSQTSQDPSNNPKSFKNLKKMHDFGLLAVSLPALLRPQGGPKMAQEGPKRGQLGWVLGSATQGASALAAQSP
eukprot:7844848-Pyramimonas_sp.AAC.1